MFYHKNIPDGKEMTINTIEDLLNMHRTAPNETTIISEILKIIKQENVIMQVSMSLLRASISIISS